VFLFYPLDFKFEIMKILGNFLLGLKIFGGGGGGGGGLV
jgi:hypothetical protein